MSTNDDNDPLGFLRKIPTGKNLIVLPRTKIEDDRTPTHSSSETLRAPPLYALELYTLHNSIWTKTGSKNNEVHIEKLNTILEDSELVRILKIVATESLPFMFGWGVRRDGLTQTKPTANTVKSVTIFGIRGDSDLQPPAMLLSISPLHLRDAKDFFQRLAEANQDFVERCRKSGLKPENDTRCNSYDLATQLTLFPRKG